MTKPTGKKRGRPRKLPGFIVRLGEDPKKWDEWLFKMGFPKEKGSTKEILEHMLPPIGEDGSGNPAYPRIGDRLGDRSFTLPSDWFFGPYKSDEDANSRRYLEYMDVVAEHLSPKDKGAELKRLFREDAWSRQFESRAEIPAGLGTPEDLKRRLAHREVEIRLKSNRREHVICFVIHPIPPDREEDLDEAGEPEGHWEGLKWFPDRSQ